MKSSWLRREAGSTSSSPNGNRPIDRPSGTLAGRQYFRLLSLLSGSKIDEELGAFSIISRRVARAFLKFQERDRHYLMILYWLGFEATTIEYDREIRTIGQSSYSLRKLIVMGLSGMFFSTTRLLHWVIYGGLILPLPEPACPVLRHSMVHRRLGTGVDEPHRRAARGGRAHHPQRRDNGALCRQDL